MSDGRRFTRRQSFVLAMVAAAGALATAHVAASGEAPPFREVTEVQVVELPVVARGADGAPLRDLAAGDLELSEDGVAVPITQLRRVESNASAPAEAAEPPLRVAVYVDEVFVGPASRRVLLDKVGKVLSARLRPEDEVMVAASDGGTRILLPFTRDRRGLRRALEDAEGMSVTRLAADDDRRTMLDGIAMDASGNMGWSPCLHVQEFVDAFATREEQRAKLAASSLGAFVGSLGSLRGRKLVFHVSDGVPLHPGAEASEVARRMCGGGAMAQGEHDGKDTTGHPDVYDPAHRSLGNTERDMTREWGEVVVRANAGDVVIESLQAGETNQTRIRSAADEVKHGDVLTPQSQVADLQDTLFLLADQTGGRLMLHGADVESAVGRAIDEARAYYVVTFTPPARPPGTDRHVTLATKRPGVSLQYRRLYRLRSIHEQLAEQLLGRLLLGGAQEASPYALELVRQQPVGDGSSKVRFRLRVPLASIAMTGDDPRRGQFTVLLAASDEAGRTTGVREREVPVLVPAGKPLPPEYAWEVEMPLHAGAQRLGVAVRDETSGAVAFVVRRFDVAAR